MRTQFDEDDSYARLVVETLGSHREVARAGIANAKGAVNNVFDLLNIPGMTDAVLCGRTGKTRSELLINALKYLTSDPLNMPPQIAMRLIDALVGKADEVAVKFDVVFDNSAEEGGPRRYENFQILLDPISLT